MPPRIGEYTLFHTFNARYTYFGVLVIKSKSVYGFKSHPDNPVVTGKYEYKKGKAQFLTGPYKGQAALFTINKGVYGVELDVRHVQAPRDLARRVRPAGPSPRGTGYMEEG